jgi:threonine/homoserine/homoserine lactone efflux protein
MTLETAIALIVFLVPLAYSPGPGNAFFAAIGASQGLRAAVPALAGYHAATVVVTLLLGIGMGVTILTNPVVSTVLTAAGSLYVLWLAFTFIRSARARAKSVGEVAETRSIGFWSGAVVLLLNPKAYYIIAVMFTQFLRPPANDEVLLVVAITVIFTVNNLIAFTAWAVGGRALTALFHGDRARQVIDYVFAATLVGVAVWMLLPLFN